jgi:exopolysaccharide biosynthesis polyprenyl glycosylphosphotransferase
VSSYRSQVSVGVDRAPAGAIQEPAGHAPATAIRPSGLRGLRRVALWIGATDAVSILAAFLLAYSIRFGDHFPSARALAAMILVVPLWIAVFTGYGLYRIQHFAPAEELRRIISATSIGITIVVAGSFWSKSAFPRLWIGLSWVFALTLLLGGRVLWHKQMYRMRMRGGLTLRTLIVGDNTEAVRIANTLTSGPFGFAPIGYLAPVPSSDRVGTLDCLGSLRDVSRIIKTNAVECIYVASSALSGEEATFLTREVRGAGVQMRVSTNVYDVLSSRLAILPVADLLALSLAPVRLSGFQSALKRAFDVIVSAVLFVLLLPFLLGIALSIKLDSRGPVLFRQARITKGGRSFTVLKFRTMVVDANRILRERAIDPTVPFFKMKEDPRLTRVGKILRRLSFDELPQLLNVLKGDMSLVGPRPLPADQVAANLELLGPRHEVRTGVTGWWQIKGRSDVDAEEALRLDLFYIENWSLSLDLYILAKTAGATFARRGAY